MTSENPEIQHYLSAAHFLRDRAEKLSFEAFHGALSSAVGADENYARVQFIRFQNNPAAFLASRNPQTQSEEILREMLWLEKR